MTEQFGFRVIPIHPQDSLPVVMVFMKSGPLFVEFSMSWVNGYNLETKLFLRFPYNENLMRAINTTSLEYCLPSTDAIDRQERKFTHA